MTHATKGIPIRRSLIVKLTLIPLPGKGVGGNPAMGVRLKAVTVIFPRKFFVEFF